MPETPTSSARSGWFSSMPLLQRITGQQQEEEDEGVASMSCFPSLTYYERIMGFTACFLAGTIIWLFSFGSFTEMLTGNPSRFALTYTLGNVISLFSSCFLVGPMQQLKNMSDKNRRMASMLYVGSLIGTLVLCFTYPISLLIIILVIAQFVAMSWYTLSYIPFGRSVARRLLVALV
eukprot:GDKI01026139.1.p1 GENE.GDKI01026139.1~~GDKI01026139.1.p1  ORF type:complete len:177 (+),score=14.84 GDKI01026139.1:68-598(+)